MIMKKANERGITLIALVITIIVLIILASVSIAMLTGDNGILKKAITAKEKTIEAEDEEKINLAILAARDNNGDFNRELLKEELGKYGLTGEDGENGTTTVTANGKKYTIDSEGRVTSEDLTENDDKKEINNITAQMVAENPEKYYGLKVTNYESTNGQNDWKIFYSDGTHIFLITGDYVDLSVANRLSSNTGMTKTGTKYRAYWSSAPSSLQTVEDTVKTRFMATGYTLNSSKNNSKCVSTLLNASNWESYKDNNGMAEYAIGGSTIEMWTASWNKLCDKKYNKPSDKLYWKASTAENHKGYYLGTSENEEKYGLSKEIMQAKDGYKNSLYYPHREDNIIDGDNNVTCRKYWLVSPSAAILFDLITIQNDGYIIYHDCTNNSGDEAALRPVVSLNSGIKVNATEAQ